ncbi:MAG: type II secretion system F family protein [Actinomycetes bacterium]
MTDVTLLAVGTASVFLAVTMMVLLMATASTGTTGVARSLATIERMGRGGAVAPQELAAHERLLQPFLGVLRRLALRLSPSGVADKLQYRLDVAGNPRGWDVEKVLAYKGLGLLGLGGLGALMGMRNPAAFVFLAAGGAAAGFFLPNVLLYNVGVKRQQKIRKSLADALDMLTISVEAGLGFDAALSQVARNTDGPLAGEFFRVLQEMQIGKSRAEAFRAVAARTTVPEFRAFVGSLVQADNLGIPVAHVLREQSKEMRLKRRQRAEETAMKIPVKILFPLIFCIFPALFVVIIGPGALRIAEAFSGS